MIDPEVAAHYELGLEESRLFADGRPRLEYVRTLELLDRFLPPAPARVLDVGGGTGVYAVALCALGYQVHVVDPIALHVARANEIGQERGLTGITASIGDARDLGDFDAGAYDAVLLLGPLYHLVERPDRVRAFAEAVRVTKPGGAVIGAGISRYASLFEGLKHRLLGDPVFAAIVERDLLDGQHRNPDPRARPDFFTTAYFHLPDELVDEAVTAGLHHVRLLAVEGPALMVEDADDLPSQLRAARATESVPALSGATSHMIVVGTVADP